MKTVVLISSAGRRTQLMECFREDARRLGLDISVLAADCEPSLSPACHKADHAFSVPLCTSLDYVPEMLRICREFDVGLLIPTIDPELLVLSRASDQFEQIKTRVAISRPDVVALADDKRAMADHLDRIGVPTPKTTVLSEYLRDDSRLRWPLIAKPRNSRAGKHIVVPRRAEELRNLADTADMIVQELWQGLEYTVNLFFDQTGRLRSVVPHLRMEVRAGEVAKARTERVGVLTEAAHQIAQSLPGTRGPLCFQAIISESGDFVVLELNARFGGGYPLAHRAGAPFSKWLLEETIGTSCTASDNWRANITMLRYDDAVFVS
jgi:carbamoyl-phosphate synthase large subunit